MAAENVRLNITLPFSIVDELTQMTGPRKRSQFIAEAVKLRLKQLKDEKKQALLVEGYQAEKEEGLNITKEFEAIDINDWDDY